LANVRAGIDLAVAIGDLWEASRGWSNLGSELQSLGDLPAADEAIREASRIIGRIGHVPGMRFSAGNLIEMDFVAGRWQLAEQRADEFLDVSAKGSHYMDGIALCARSMIALARDRAELARADVERAIVAGRKIGDPQMTIPALATGAFVYVELGELEHALALLEELEPTAFIGSAALAFFAASTLDDADVFRERARPFARGTRWDRAAEAVLDGRWVEAANVYEEIGARPYAGLAALRATQTFVADGRRAEADNELRRALAFFRSVGATRYIREGESLLAASA
jgi:tetratricopeptide (TPR) repeat protein